MADLRPASPTCPACHGFGSVIVEETADGPEYDVCDCRLPDYWPFVRAANGEWVPRGTISEVVDWA